MGYWLSSSKVGQYIVRDDKIRTKTVFPTDDIWVLGVHYEFEGSDQTVSPPEPTRTRKTSALQIHTGPARGLGSKSSSLNGFGPAEARDSKHGSDRRRSHISSPRSMTDSEAISSFPSSLKSDKDPTRERHLDKQREKELAKARKLAKAHEREVEKEHERALEKERAVEKSRLKEKEKLEKLRLKISHPHFQKDVLENKHQGALLRPEPDRKSHSVHGYQFEGQSNSGISLAPPDFSEPKHSVIRRMRSISILPKVPTASDLKHAKKPSQESTSGVLPERGHQPRSQSVSSFSVFSHRSGASSSISSHSLDSPSRNRPNSPPIPSGLSSSISMHEVFASQSKTSSSSKTTQVEVSQKQLPNLPSFDDSSDLPYDNQQENDQAEYVEKDANKHQAPSATAGARPSKRRMTISGIFSKDAKPESTSSLATLKTLVAAGSNKIQAKVKEPGMVQALTQKVSFVSLSNKDSSSNSKKGVTKNVHHWLERRLSSHNLPQQIFVASTDVPVPPVSQDAVNSPPSSPLSPNVYKMPEERSDQKQTRTRKSSLNQSPTSTSPKSALKASSPLSSTSARFTEARERPSSPLGISGLNDIGETPSIAAFPKFNESETLVEEMISWTSLLGPAIRPTLDQSTESTQQSAGLPLSFAEGVSKVERPPVRPVNQRQHSSFADLVILPPLPPESPSEAFILLDKMKNASVTSLERSPDDSLFALPLMSGSMNTGQHSGLSAEKDDSSARSQATETDSDSFDVQNKRLFDRLAAFSNSKEESVSDLRTDWEALWPSKKSSQLTKEPETSGAGFVHIKEKEAPKAADPDEEEKQRRERIRKIGSAYLKVKAPTSDLASGYLNVVGATPASSAALQPLDIISPKPLHPMAQQQQPSNSGLGDSLTIVRTASPMQSPDLLHDRRTTSAPSSRESTLLLPVTADRASQPSPISTSSSLERSWKAITAISPRSISPRHTLPALPSSTTTTTSSRSASGMNSSLDIVGDDKKQENGSSRDSSISTKRPKSDELLSIPIISPTQASSLEKQESLSTSPSLSSIVDKLSPNQATLLKFLSDFQSRIWFTYRKDMARIEPAYYTSDAGWGCMMRTGQSLLAQAFVQLMLGREWRTDLAQTELNRQKYKTILSWFADEPDRYYSIHSIAKMGQVLDKRIGEWFGPSTMAHALRRLSEKHVNCPLTIMVPMDNSIRMSDIVNEASVAHGSSPPSLWGDFMSTLGSSGNNSSDKNGGQQTKWKPVVLLLPARFGLEKLTQKYISNLKKLFQLPQFLGIAGGRPGRSLYFVANQGSELFYFDPHFVKTRATPDELNQCPASSYHCQSVRTMEMLELDPSMMLGFLISSFTDLIDLSTRLKQEMEKAYPLLTLVVDVPIPTPAPEPEPAPEPIAIPIATPAQVASPSLAAMFAPISKSIPVAAPALSPISFSTPLTTPSFAAASVSAPGDVPTSASAPVSFQETVRTFIPVPVPGSALPRTITPVAAAVSSPASVLAPARSPTLTPARLATAVPLSSTTSTSLAVQESVPARASTPTPIHVSTPIPIRILTPRPTVTPEVTPIFAHVSAPVPGPESTSALVSSVSAPALGPVSTSKSFSETTQANTALKPEAFDVMVPAPVSAPAPVVAPVLVPVSTSTWLSWPEPEIDAPMSVPGPVLTPVSTRTLVPELEAIPISVPTPVATPVFTLTSNSTSISTLSTPVPEPEPETEPESKSGLASQLEFEAELELELPSEPVSVPVVAPAIASVVSPLVSPVISPVVVIPTTETITTAEDEMSEFVTRNSDEGRMGGEIVPGDTTILFVEAKGSMRVTHVEAVVDEDDDDDEEEKDAKENEDKEREEKDRSTVEEGPSSSSSLARPQLTLTESFASLEIASGDDNHEDGIIASDTLLSPPVPEQDDHGFASDTSLADISTTNTMAETQTLPAGQRRQTNKRAMKRITKALKKEKKLRSIESINALAQEQQQQQQQQQEQQQSLQHHHSHHHNIFHRKGHHSTKKAQQTEEERQRQAYDPYQYRYTSHDGDHVHDQETLSVKSLDSGDEDTLL
ncbi:Cysteine protease atg4b [Gryganskiella cystojenkinii]|nr:Cysteine protease atg4b [Gryganskiella cystojenkinii]